MARKSPKSQTVPETGNTLFKWPPNDGEKIKRIVDIDDIKGKFKKELLEAHGINMFEQQSRPRPEIEKADNEIDELARAIRESIVWGVYGSSGELLEIVDKRYGIERLEARDAKALQDLYAEGLKNESPLFGSRLEIERVKTIEEVKDFIAKNYVIGVRQPCLDRNGNEKERLVGIASVKRGKNERAHIAEAGLLYVEPALRTKGLASEISRHILDAVIKGRPEELKGIEQLEIVVTATNKFAFEYYKRLGFRQTRYRPSAAKHGDRYYDWIDMMLDVPAERRKKAEEERQKELECAPVSIRHRKRPRPCKKSGNTKKPKR